MKLEKVISLAPSNEQLSKLLKLFHNKQYNDVEKLALVLTKKFSKHQFAWKILGITSFFYHPHASHPSLVVLDIGLFPSFLAGYIFCGPHRCLG